MPLFDCSMLTSDMFSMVKEIIKSFRNSSRLSELQVQFGPKKTEDERDKHFKKFISMPVGVEQTILLSTDGILRIPTTPTIARKPGQQKKVRNKKTVTIKQKRMKVKKVEHE